MDQPPATPEQKQNGKMSETSKWRPLESLLEKLLRELSSQSSSSFFLELRTPGTAPYPYCQVGANSGFGFVLEFSPEQELLSHAPPRSSNVLKATNWHTPDESNPNWHKVLGEVISHDLVAKHLIVIARAAFGVSRSTWMRLEREQHSRVLPAEHGLMVDPVDPFLFRLPTDS